MKKITFISLLAICFSLNTFGQVPKKTNVASPAKKDSVNATSYIIMLDSSTYWQERNYIDKMPIPSSLKDPVWELIKSAQKVSVKKPK